jgi:Domain of unknown function (DUF4252)
MTKTKKTLQLALAFAMIGGPMAIAQQVAENVQIAIPSLDLQTNVTVNVAYQAKDDLFAGAEKFAQGASEVTEINLDPNTMGLVGETHGRDAQEARKMKSMVIHTFKYDKPGMYRTEDVDAYRKKLEDGSWNCSIHVRNTNGSTDICSRTAADHETNEMVILTVEPQKLTFIHMSGKMSLGELNDMSGSVGNFRPHTNLPRPMVMPPMPPMPPKAPKAPKAKGVPPEPPATPAPPAPPVQ